MCQVHVQAIGQVTHHSTFQDGMAMLARRLRDLDWKEVYLETEVDMVQVAKAVLFTR